MLITSRKKVVGESSGKTMVQKRRDGLAPSIAAASISDFGIDCSPARLKRKLHEICFHTAAITTSAIAWSPWLIEFQSMPKPFSTEVTMPIDGAHRNTQSAPAIAGATPE